MLRILSGLVRKVNADEDEVLIFGTNMEGFFPDSKTAKNPHIPLLLPWFSCNLFFFFWEQLSLGIIGDALNCASRRPSDLLILQSFNIPIL